MFCWVTTARTFRLMTLLGLTISSIGMASCSNSGSRVTSTSEGNSGGQSVDRKVSKGLDSSERYVGKHAPPDAAASTAAAPPVALISGAPVRWDELRPYIIEAAGATALEEIALNRMLEKECAARSIIITERDLTAERANLAEVLVVTGAVDTSDPAAVDRALTQVRADRGLGDVRFASLVRRTAMMRKLVQPEVAVTEAAIDQARQMRYGERFSARVITVPTAADASRVIQRVQNNGESFEVVASQVSTDPSAMRGGLIETVSPVDPTWPSALREALTTMQPGQVLASPIAIDNGFVIVKLVERISAQTEPPIDQYRPGLEREVRLRQERLLMTRLARRLMTEMDVSVIDEALREAWRARPKP